MARWVNRTNSWWQNPGTEIGMDGSIVPELTQYQALQVPVVSGPIYGPPAVWDGLGNFRVSTRPHFTDYSNHNLGDFRDETYAGVSDQFAWSGWYLVEQVDVPDGCVWASPMARYVQYTDRFTSGNEFRFGFSRPTDDGVMTGKDEDINWANWGGTAQTYNFEPTILWVPMPTLQNVAADGPARVSAWVDAVRNGTAQIGAAIGIYAGQTLRITGFWMEFRYPLPEDGKLPW